MAEAVLEIICADHKRIRKILDQVAKTDQKKLKQRRELWGDLRRELSRHSLLEEDVLYARLKNSAKARPFNTIASAQHGTVDRLIRLLERTPLDSERWMRTLLELRVLMIDHMNHEENELRYLIPIAFNAKELRSLILKLKLCRAA